MRIGGRLVKTVIQQGRRRKHAGGVTFSPTRAELSDSSYPRNYVEDCFSRERYWD